MGMVNQLGKISSNIAELSKPLQELLSKQNTCGLGVVAKQIPLTRLKQSSHFLQS